MPDTHEVTNQFRIARNSRRRFAYAGFTLLLYFLFTLNWMEAGAFLRTSAGDSSFTWGMVMFVVLVVGFLLLEYLYLRGSDVISRVRTNKAP